MRIVIDLQACQSAGSRFRGIGRYSKSLAMAMVRADRGHEFWIALNGGLTEAVEDIRASFAGLLPQERIVLWDNPFPATEHQQPDPWRNRAAEVVREDFLAALQPDVVHIASLFEGWDDAIAASIGRGSAGRVRTAVTLYDLIPLAMSELYLQDPPTRRWYERKLEDLKRADLCLAISDFTRRQGMQLLGLPADRVVNISGSIDPVFQRLPANARRSEALAARYGIWRPFVMYTGGFDPRKNVAGLIRAYASLPRELRECRQLLIVGNPTSHVQAELAGVVAASGLAASEVCFAGFVPDADLVGLYNACELYVFPSRCEGFGLPALEAMACGAPVIGADASSLPEVIGYPDALFDAGSDQAMSTKMHEALGDVGLRTRLLAHAAERAGLFSWEASANTALDALEQLVRTPAFDAGLPARDTTDSDPRSFALARQSQALAELLHPRELRVDEYRRLALAQSANHALPATGRQLIVDISNLVRHDAKTGIQRVVRNILRELFALAPAGFRVEPVWFDDAGVCRYAREFVARFRDEQVTSADSVLDARIGDVFLGLDLSAHIVPGQYQQFAELRRRGVVLYFVVYDLVPLLRPDCVNPTSLTLFHQWYAAIGTLADGLCCISAAVAAELLEWCDQVRPLRQRPLHIGHFHLGADMDLAMAAKPELASAVVQVGQRPTLLMVGTIEPRKGYVQTLDAFELLWSQGVDAALAIVGKPGWLMEPFVARMRKHVEFGNRLHWLEDADDARLRTMYESCAALLMPSEAEGFGLPIIEAARHGLPVIARDLPVFREVAGDHASYFSGHDGDALADCIREWLGQHARGQSIPSAAMPWLDWRRSAEGLLRLVIGQGWDAAWMPGKRYWFPATDDRLASQVGARDREQRSTDGRSGFLAYGPYAALPAGHYRLRLLGAWLGGSSGKVTLDVVTEQGLIKLSHADLHPDEARAGVLHELEFSLPSDASDLETRLWVAADAGLSMRGIELTCLDRAG